MSGSSAFAALNKVAKWRKFFASWQLGTRADTDGEYKAVADHRELTILLRVEMTALTDILFKKGIITQKEFEAALEREARSLDKDYQEKFPGFRTSQAGLHMDMPAAYATMKMLGFPP